MYRKGLLLAMLSILFFTACSDAGKETQRTIEREELGLLLGNPSKATHDVLNENDYLIVLPQYALSYNRSRGIANWVSWHMSEEWIGTASRQDDFRIYDDLPAGWERVASNDYNFAINGLDRGHICPSADRTLTDIDNSATFYMINIVPQAPNHNQGIWRELEEYCRKLVDEGNELYIVSGNYGKGGTGIKGYREELAGGKVTVPGNLWKVIVVLPNGDDDLNRIDENTRIIAVDIENKNNIGGMKWSNYRVSVNEIESAAGLDLLSEISVNLQSIIEAKVDNEPIQ